MQFDRNMLPCLGVTWNYFPTRREAEAFARWAETETRREANPCEAFVTFESDQCDGQQWVVKTRNW
jgi:hypothetical protein